MQDVTPLTAYHLALDILLMSNLAHRLPLSNVDGLLPK